jgi:acetolactate synthase-1/2/3 large subunit
VCVFNNAASGYVKALQHAVYREGRYQSSDLVEMNYAAIARSMGCAGIRVTAPDKISEALRAGLENVDSRPRYRGHARSGADVAGNR